MGASKSGNSMHARERGHMNGYGSYSSADRNEY